MASREHVRVHANFLSRVKADLIAASDHRALGHRQHTGDLRARPARSLRARPSGDRLALRRLQGPASTTASTASSSTPGGARPIRCATSWTCMDPNVAQLVQAQSVAIDPRRPRRAQSSTLARRRAAHGDGPAGPAQGADALPLQRRHPPVRGLVGRAWPPASPATASGTADRWHRSSVRRPSSPPTRHGRCLTADTLVAAARRARRSAVHRRGAAPRRAPCGRQIVARAAEPDAIGDARGAAAHAGARLVRGDVAAEVRGARRRRVQGPRDEGRGTRVGSGQSPRFKGEGRGMKVGAPSLFVLRPSSSFVPCPSNPGQCPFLPRPRRPGVPPPGAARAAGWAPSGSRRRRWRSARSRDRRRAGARRCCPRPRGGSAARSRRRRRGGWPPRRGPRRQPRRR